MAGWLHAGHENSSVWTYRRDIEFSRRPRGEPKSRAGRPAQQGYARRTAAKVSSFQLTDGDLWTKSALESRNQFASIDRRVAGEVRFSLVERSDRMLCRGRCEKILDAIAIEAADRHLLSKNRFRFLFVPNHRDL